MSAHLQRGWRSWCFWWKNCHELIRIKCINALFQRLSLPLLALLLIFLLLVCAFLFLLCISSSVLPCLSFWRRRRRSEPEKWTWLQSFWLWEKKLRAKAAANDYDECVAPRCVIYLSGVIADNAVMSFPKTWGISERTAAPCAQIYGRLTDSVVFLFF